MPDLFNKPLEFRKRPELREGLNQLLEATPRLITGDGVLLKKMADRFVIELDNSNYVYQSAQVQNFVVLEEHEDYLDCVVFYFTNQPQLFNADLGIELQKFGLTGVPMKVAKPVWLQQTPYAGATVLLNGEMVTLTFTGVSQRLYSPSNGLDVLQDITPSYFAGDIITAKAGPTGVAYLDDNKQSHPIQWTDINTAARQWISQDTGIVRALWVMPGQNVETPAPGYGSTTSAYVGEETLLTYTYPFDVPNGATVEVDVQIQIFFDTAYKQIRVYQTGLSTPAYSLMWDSGLFKNTDPGKFCVITLRLLFWAEYNDDPNGTVQISALAQGITILTPSGISASNVPPIYSENAGGVNLGVSSVFKITGEASPPLVPPADWSAGVSYVAWDYVLYDGKIYKAIVDNIGVIPSENPNIWLLLGLGSIAVLNGRAMYAPPP